MKKAHIAEENSDHSSFTNNLNYDHIYYSTHESQVISNKDMWKYYLIKKYPHNRGLDIGSGSGKWLNKFPSWNGIDMDKRALVNKRVKLSSVTKIPFPDNSFDVLLASHVLEHIPREKFPTALKEMKRVLKKDGHIFIFGPNPSYYNFYTDYTHVNPVNHLSLASVFENHGYTVIESDFSVYKRFWFRRLIPRAIINIISPLILSEYYLVLKKK